MTQPRYNDSRKLPRLPIKEAVVYEHVRGVIPLSKRIHFFSASSSKQDNSFRDTISLQYLLELVGDVYGTTPDFMCISLDGKVRRLLTDKTATAIQSQHEIHKYHINTNSL